MKMLGEKLIKAFEVINFSNKLSLNYEEYVKSSFCYLAFPICRIFLYFLIFIFKR